MKLVAREGGRDIPLRDGLVLGRAEDCGAVLADESVSRHHARVERRSQDWWVVDLSSSNGTRVNGQRVTEFRLRPGDLVTVGSVAFDVVAPAAPVTAAKHAAPAAQVAAAGAEAAGPSAQAGRADSAASAELARLRAEARQVQRARGLGDLGQQPLRVRAFAFLLALLVLAGIFLGVRWLGHALAGP